MKTLNLLPAAILFSVAAFAQNTGTLNLTKGKVYRVESVIMSNNKTNAMGQMIESKADMTSVYEIAVKDEKNDEYKIGSTVKAFKMDIGAAGQEMKYDSENPADSSSMFASSFKNLLNHEQIVSVDKSGKLVDMDKDSTLLSATMEQMKNSGFGTNLAFIALPKNIKAGDTWTAGSSDSAAIQTTTHYTVKSITGDLVNLAFTGETKTKMTIENQGMEVETKTTGTFEGNAMVEKSGVVQVSKNVGKASGTVSVMGQEMPVDVNVTSETTVKEIK